MATLFRRRLVRILALCVFLLVVLVVAARLLVPADKVRDLIVSQIKDQTGIDVAFGEAKVAILPRIRVVVADGRFAGTGSDLATGQSAGGPAVGGTAAGNRLESFQGELESLEVDLALWPLLRKRIEIGKIRLIGPHLEIVTKPEPAPDLVPRGQAPGASPPPVETSGTAVTDAAAPVPWEFAFVGLEIRDGSLHWQEAGSAKRVEVTGWQQEVSAARMALLRDRLLAFGYGTPPPAATDPATLDLTSRVASLSLKGYGEGPPLELDAITLRGKLTVPLSADRVQVSVEELGWRHLNLTADLQLTPPSAEGSRLQGSWRLAALSLRDGSADLLALAPPPEGQLADWLAQEPVKDGHLNMAGSLDLPWPLPADLSPPELLSMLSLEGSVSEAKVALPNRQGMVEAAADFTVATGRLSSRQMSLRTADGSVTLNGNLSMPLPGATGDLQAAVIGQADLAALAAFLPSPDRDDGTASAAAPWQLAGNLQWETKLDLSNPPAFTDGPAWRMLWEEGRLQGIQFTCQARDLSLAGLTPGDPWQITTASLASDLRSATFSIMGLSHPTLRGDLTGKALRLFPQPELALTLEVGRVDVDRLVALWQPAPTTALDFPRGSLFEQLVQQWVGLAWAAPPPRADPPPLGELIPANLVVAYKGEADEVLLKKARYDRVRLWGKLSNRVARFDSVTAGRSGGVIRGEGQIDYRTDPYGRLDFVAIADAVPAAALIEPYAPAIAALWEGTVTANVTGGCSLKDEAAVLATLSLVGTTRSTNGHVDARSLLEDITPYLGARQDLKVIRFKEFLHDLDVEEGRYHLHDLHLTGPDTDWQGDGWLGFDGTIDMQLSVKLPANFTPQLGDLTFLADNLRDEEGRIQLGFRLTGRAAKPAVNLDMTRAKAATQEKVDKTVKDKVQGLLDKWKRK